MAYSLQRNPTSDMVQNLNHHHVTCSTNIPRDTILKVILVARPMFNPIASMYPYPCRMVKYIPDILMFYVLASCGPRTSFWRDILPSEDGNSNASMKRSYLPTSLHSVIPQRANIDDNISLATLSRKRYVWTNSAALFLNLGEILSLNCWSAGTKNPGPKTD